MMAMPSSLYGREVLIPNGTDNPFDGNEPYSCHDLRAVYNNALHFADTNARVLIGFGYIPFAFYTDQDTKYAAYTAKRLPLTLRSDGSTCPIRICYAVAHSLNGTGTPPDLEVTFNLWPSSRQIFYQDSPHAKFQVTLSDPYVIPGDDNWAFGVIPSIPSDKVAQYFFGDIYSKAASGDTGTRAMDEVLADLIITISSSDNTSYSELAYYGNFQASEFQGY